MPNSPLRSNVLLLIAAAIWGFGFVAQRLGMDHLGPYGFNTLRFLLGAVVLLPIIVVCKSEKSKANHLSRRSFWLSGFIAGLLLFAGATLQQIGLVTTTAGNAAFITGLYLILVPVFGIVCGHKTGRFTWIGAALALVGLYLLCVNDDMRISVGDLFVLVGACAWAGHVLYIARVAGRVDALRLAALQFSVCALCSYGCALSVETMSWAAIIAAKWALLFAGVVSVGLAYTLQVIGQKGAHPSQAAIILSLESVFGVLGGILFLSEELSLKAAGGCAFMFMGMLLSQCGDRKKLAAPESVELEPQTLKI